MAAYRWSPPPKPQQNPLSTTVTGYFLPRRAWWAYGLHVTGLKGDVRVYGPNTIIGPYRGAVAEKEVSAWMASLRALRPGGRLCVPETGPKREAQVLLSRGSKVVAVVGILDGSCSEVVITLMNHQLHPLYRLPTPQFCRMVEGLVRPRGALSLSFPRCGFYPERLNWTWVRPTLRLSRAQLSYWRQIQRFDRQIVRAMQRSPNGKPSQALWKSYYRLSLPDAPLPASFPARAERRLTMLDTAVNTEDWVASDALLFGSRPVPRSDSGQIPGYTNGDGPLKTGRELLSDWLRPGVQSHIATVARDWIRWVRSQRHG